MVSRLKAVAVVSAVACVALVWGCPGPPGPACAEENQACTGNADCCEGLECVDGMCATPVAGCAGENESCDEAADCCDGLICAANVCVVPGTGGTAALPAKTIAFDLIGIHDPDSESYNSDCVGFHGDRTNEVALDGVTPTAHSRMLSLFGEGNDRCIACHQSGPDFLAQSAANLRKQVSLEDVQCAGCHKEGGAPGAPPFYVRP